jgi:predicted Rossmann-fold nucleotide-binding protein
MGAVARGAAKAGGLVVGLPMTPWKHLTPDSNHAELRWSDTYAQRLAHLLQTRVTIALPGGIGTLAEASGIWEAAQTEIGAAQLVFVGDAWRRLLATFAHELVIDEHDLAIPIVVNEVDEVIAAARRLMRHPSPRMPSHG